jgi:DNA-binding response OmpR family regulator
MKSPLALIIEDDRRLGTIFAEATRTAGFEVEIIQDGQTALARLADTTPSLVVLDLHLPYVSGQEILRHIRSDERLAKMHVILATADPLMAEAFQAEADLVLIKPVSFSQLRDLASRLHPPHRFNP